MVSDKKKWDSDHHAWVLILVVMEYGLRQSKGGSQGSNKVLILVVMEYGLRRSSIEERYTI